MPTDTEVDSMLRELPLGDTVCVKSTHLRACLENNSMECEPLNRTDTNWNNQSVLALD